MSHKLTLTRDRALIRFTVSVGDSASGPGAHMLVQQRRNLIIERLNTRQGSALSVSGLSEAFEVSPMTIRRDLDWLHEHGLLTRVRGGAVPIATHLGLPFEERGETSVEEKVLIGRAGAELVGDGEQIILDSGTTTTHLARGLGSRRGVTVVTNALPVAEELSRCGTVSTVLLGGMLKRRELCTVGPPVSAELAHLSVDKAFISAAGFSADMGATDPDLREAEVKQAMMRAAEESYLVVDSAKWGVRALAQIAPLEAFSVLVTDDGIGAAALEAIASAGARVVIASEKSPQ